LSDNEAETGGTAQQQRYLLRRVSLPLVPTGLVRAV